MNKVPANGNALGPARVRVKGELPMEMPDFVRAFGRWTGIGLALPFVCALASGCQSWHHHKDYFAEMAAAMPAHGRLWLDSQVGGMSASYVGPGLANEATVRLVGAHYDKKQPRLELHFASPVKVCEDAELGDLVEFADDDGKPIPVGKVFGEEVSVSSRSCCRRVIFVPAGAEHGFSNVASVCLLPTALVKRCACAACGTVRLSISE